MERTRDSKWYDYSSLDVSTFSTDYGTAFQTAVALPLYDAKGSEIPVVKESHLQQVVSMSRAFKNYIMATHEDMTDAEMTYKSGLRDDSKDSTQ
jgi:hypothetical protein